MSDSETVVLDICTTVKTDQVCAGVPCNASSKVDVVLTGLTLFGHPGRLRVYVSRSPEGVKGGNETWDWRSYVEVLDQHDVSLSLTEPTSVKFTTPVPIPAGGTRRLYIYSYADQTDPYKGVAYRRFKNPCAQDEVLTLASADGNWGGAHAPQPTHGAAFAHTEARISHTRTVRDHTPWRRQVPGGAHSGEDHSRR
jgi:hypothetical protein